MKPAVLPSASCTYTNGTPVQSYMTLISAYERPIKPDHYARYQVSPQHQLTAPHAIATRDPTTLEVLLIGINSTSDVRRTSCNCSLISQYPSRNGVSGAAGVGFQLSLTDPESLSIHR